MSTTTRNYRHRSALPAPFRAGSGIYAIVNSSNNKLYIGSAVRLHHRWTEHRCELEDGKHHSQYLQRAFNKNPEAFYIEVIEELNNPDKVLMLGREQFWMDFYKSYLPSNGYNISPTAESCQGIKRSPEMIAKISAGLKGKKFSHERLAIHRARKRPTKFRSFTPEQKEEARQRKLGKPNTLESRRKISAALKANPYQARAVHQFTLDGVYLKTFKTIVEAEMVFGKRIGIAEACIGRTRHARGFQWRYADQVKPTDVVKMRPNNRWPKEGCDTR